MLDVSGDRAHAYGEGRPLGADLADCGRCSAPWHVARYNPADHRLVRPAVHRLGFSTFLPLIRETVLDRRLGQRTRTVPAFTGALFVQWREGAHWWRILGQPGILGGPAGLVRPVGDPFGHPAAVPAEVMAELLARASDGGVIEDASVPPILGPLEAGAAVQVLRGLWAGRNGVAGPLRGGKRHVVEVDGKRVLIPRRDLEPL
ncbi:MAG TPA: hypothetical protein VEX11_14765 [Acetobacteraceae bacterium]|nr:hypothetical protein [Acetobacteraceae bacterium]